MSRCIHLSRILLGLSRQLLGVRIIRNPNPNSATLSLCIGHQSSARSCQAESAASSVVIQRTGRLPAGAYGVSQDADVGRYHATRRPYAPPTQDGNKHTYTGPSLPDFYLQKTCKFAIKSALVRRPIARRLPCYPRPCSSTRSTSTSAIGSLKAHFTLFLWTCAEKTHRRPEHTVSGLPVGRP